MSKSGHQRKTSFGSTCVVCVVISSLDFMNSSLGLIILKHYQRFIIAVVTNKFTYSIKCMAYVSWIGILGGASCELSILFSCESCEWNKTRRPSNKTGFPINNTYYIVGHHYVLNLRITKRILMKLIISIDISWSI